MIMRFCAVAVLLSLALSGPAAAQQLKDPAEAMPARVLAYAELRQPGPFVKEFVGLFENSFLGNVPESVHRILADLKVPPPPRGLGELGAAGLFLSPEVVQEAQRLQGMGVALTGLGERGEPEFVVVGLPGESNIPRLVFRALLTMERVKPSATVEGVTVFRPFRNVDGKPGRDRGPVVDGKLGVDVGPAFAMMPQALIMGSPGAVKDAILRIKGKAKTPSLAADANFRKASTAVGNAPGVFAYIGIAEAMEIVGKLPLLGQPEKQVFDAVGQLLNFKAFRAQAYSLTLEKATLRYREIVLLDPKEKSPILDVMPSAPVPRELFQFTPADTVLAFGLSNDQGEKRWKVMIDFADQLAKNLGGNAVPSEQLDKAQQALGIDLGKDIMERITAVGFALGDPFKAPIKRVDFLDKDGKRRGGATSSEFQIVLTIQASSDEAAGKLIEEVIPKLYGAMLQRDAKPTTKEIQGQKVHTLPGDAFWSLNYGRQGKTIVLGHIPQPVAQALNNGAKKQGMHADAKVADYLKGSEKAVMLGVGKPMSLIRGMMGVVVVREESRGTGRGGDAPRRKDEKRPEPRDRDREPEHDARPEANPFIKEFTRLVENEGLITLSVAREDDRLLEEIRWTNIKPGVGQLVDLGLKTYLILGGESKGHPKDAPPDRRKGDVDGKVHFKGQPLNGGAVTLVGDLNDTYSGELQPDGTYKVRNVPSGAYRVVIAAAAPDPGKKPARVVRIPVKYGHPQTSGLTCIVQPGQQTVDFDLQ
jgi:hypothetical protein